MIATPTRCPSSFVQDWSVSSGHNARLLEKLRMTRTNGTAGKVEALGELMAAEPETRSPMDFGGRGFQVRHLHAPLAEICTKTQPRVSVPTLDSTPSLTTHSSLVSRAVADAASSSRPPRDTSQHSFGLCMRQSEGVHLEFDVDSVLRPITCLHARSSQLYPLSLLGWMPTLELPGLAGRQLPRTTSTRQAV